MGNTLTSCNGLTLESHSIIVPVNYFACCCAEELLKGSYRGRLLDMLREAVERAGFGVIGESAHPFGNTTAERNTHGSTLNLILEDSGISYDCYPEIGTVQSNLHYCNIKNINDHKVLGCIMATKKVLKPKITIRYPNTMMPLVFSEAHRTKALANGAEEM